MTQQELMKKLKEERNREGKKSFTTAELLDGWEKTRDSAFIAISQCLKYNGKGLKTSQDVYEFSRKEISRLKFDVEKEIKESQK